jgi:hypothetical protein
MWHSARNAKDTLKVHVEHHPPQKRHAIVDVQVSSHPHLPQWRLFAMACSSIPPLQVVHWWPEEGRVSVQEGGNDMLSLGALHNQCQQHRSQRHSKGRQPAGTAQCPCAHRPDQGSKCAQCQAKDAMGQKHACTSSPPLHPPAPLLRERGGVRPPPCSSGRPSAFCTMTIPKTNGRKKRRR